MKEKAIGHLVKTNPKRTQTKPIFKSDDRRQSTALAMTRIEHLPMGHLRWSIQNRESNKAENLQKETVQMFDERLKTAKNIIWGGIAMGVTFELVGLAGLIAGLAGKVGTNTMIFCAVLTLSGAHLPLVAKLLYWGTNIELHVLEELKQIQLEIAELAGKNRPADN